METINNVALAASKAVWGDSEAHKEPVSGAKGDVAKGEPFDAGNLEPEEQKKVEKRLSNDDNLKADHKDTALSSFTTGDTSSRQNDTRHPDQVATESKNPDASVLKGSGPKPVEVVAKEHGGDAGNIGNPTAISAQSNQRGESSETHDSEDQSKGTGEQHVKTTGFAADGGDFDATKPGAGIEADRLREQKGISQESHENPSAPAASQAPNATNGQSNVLGDKDSGSSPKSSKHSKNKPSLGERIKAKFHKHDKAEKADKTN